MSKSISILDEEGNINSSKLSKELKDALEFDIRYKQTDNMKKRAVRSATSYDEFKAMVACSHLKKLTKKEVESLAEVKKGWKKSSRQSSENPTSASILDFEQQQEELKTKNFEVVSKLKTKKKPKSSMELERDLRRLKDEDKFSYLMDLGCTNTIAIMKKGLDVDGIEEILRVLVTVSAGKAVAADDETAHPDNHLLHWFQEITKLEKFSLMLSFANAQLIESIGAYLKSQSDDERSAPLLALFGNAK